MRRGFWREACSARRVTGPEDRRRRAGHRRPSPLCSALSGIVRVVRRIGDFVVDRATSSRGRTLASNIASPDFRGSSLAGATLFRGVMLTCSSSRPVPWHDACDILRVALFRGITLASSSCRHVLWHHACESSVFIKSRDGCDLREFGFRAERQR